MIIAKLIKQLRGERELRALMLALDAGGRTSMLYSWKTGAPVEDTIPTIGFNVETVTWKKAKITFWDIGGEFFVFAFEV